MAELIGVYTAGYIEKRDLLLFDRFATHVIAGKFLEERFHETWLNEHPNLIRASSLHERDLLMEINELEHPEGGAVLQEEFARYRSAFRRIMSRYTGRPVKESFGDPEWPLVWDLDCRTLALRMRLVEKLNAVPLLTSASIPTDSIARQDQVVEILLKDLPIPDDGHSLDDVLAFRDEARAEGLIQGLRVWVNEMASGKLNPFEVSDKLEDLVSRYERTLKLEKMKRNTGIVETVVTTTAEIAESLVKFQWSKVATKLFEVRRKQIDFMQAEMNAPGREVAYIVKARERFRR